MTFCCNFCCLYMRQLIMKAVSQLTQFFVWMSKSTLLCSHSFLFLAVNIFRHTRIHKMQVYSPLPQKSIEGHISHIFGRNTRADVWYILTFPAISLPLFTIDDWCRGKISQSSNCFAIIVLRHSHISNTWGDIEDHILGKSPSSVPYVSGGSVVAII